MVIAICHRGKLWVYVQVVLVVLRGVAGMHPFSHGLRGVDNCGWGVRVFFGGLFYKTLAYEHAHAHGLGLVGRRWAEVGEVYLCVTHPQAGYAMFGCDLD